MIGDRRLVVCAALSVVSHFALARALERLPRHEEGPTKRVISLKVISPPPSLEPPPEPARVPAAPTPKLVPREIVRKRSAPPVPSDLPRTDVPPPDRPVAAGSGPPSPVFGVTMESTSQAGSGPSMPVGSTGVSPAASDEDREQAKGVKPPVPAYQVTTMPLPQGRCAGKYTEEAKQAGIEGTVVLDLVVSETGRVRDIQVVSGLAHGLTEAAIAALKQCRFSPGEKDGSPVPVRVRGFKIRFLLQNDD
jgi:protein TonB